MIRGILAGILEALVGLAVCGLVLALFVFVVLPLLEAGWIVEGGR